MKEQALATVFWRQVWRRQRCLRGTARWGLAPAASTSRIGSRNLRSGVGTARGRAGSAGIGGTLVSMERARRFATG